MYWSPGLTGIQRWDARWFCNVLHAMPGKTPATPSSARRRRSACLSCWSRKRLVQRHRGWVCCGPIIGIQPPCHAPAKPTPAGARPAVRIAYRFVPYVLPAHADFLEDSALDPPVASRMPSLMRCAVGLVLGTALPWTWPKKNSVVLRALPA